MELANNATALRIMRAAEQLFMQRGYRAVSINDIVRSADVTKPTLYYYFADKEQLFVQMAVRSLQQMHAAMQARLEHAVDTTARLRALTAVLMHETEGDISLLRREIEEHLSPGARERVSAAFAEHLLGPVAQVMQQGLERGELRQRHPFELALLFLSMLSGFQHTPAGLSLVSTSIRSFSIETIVDLFLNGVGTYSQTG